MKDANLNRMSKRVLLIDDDRDDAELFEGALNDVDDTAVFLYIEDSKEALHKLSQGLMPLPDIIFLDINMPLISGWDCLREFKADAFLNKVPIIMYSTSSQQKEISLAKDLGAASFFTKPSNYSELKTRVKDILDSFKYQGNNDSSTRQTCI